MNQEVSRAHSHIAAAKVSRVKTLSKIAFQVLSLGGFHASSRIRTKSAAKIDNAKAGIAKTMALRMSVMSGAPGVGSRNRRA